MEALYENLTQQRQDYQITCTNIREGNSQFLQSTQSELEFLHSKLEELTRRSIAAREAYHDNYSKLEDHSKRIKDWQDAVEEEKVIGKCKAVADAYLDTLRPLLRARRRRINGKGELGGAGGGEGDVSDSRGKVVGSIKRLIQEVEGMRRIGVNGLYGDSREINRRLLMSVENRCIDAVIKARAAFVNVLDNEFRSFGWPMNIPKLESDSPVLKEINFNVEQLNALQEVVKKYPFVQKKTKWYAEISDSWAMASILRGPFARFKYHFLENHNKQQPPMNGTTATTDLSTSRFDRPEWAANFALKQISEALPFLKQIIMNDTSTADLKFAEGFCQVFAAKIAEDCELALKASAEDTNSAERLISHAAHITEQFDQRLHQGLLESSESLEKRELPSALHTLSLNEGFFTTWANSELKLAEPLVHGIVQRLLDMSEGMDGENERTVDELEADVIDIVEYVSQASRGSRRLSSKERQRKFIRLTELPLLQVVRTEFIAETSKLHENPAAVSAEVTFKCSRVIWASTMIASALRNKAEEPFYCDLSDSVGDENLGIHSHNIERFENLAEKTLATLASIIYDTFVKTVSSKYENAVRFGELASIDAAVVIAHDLSSTLVKPYSALEKQLQAIAAGIPNRKQSSLLWKRLAMLLDDYMFYEVLTQAFTGGKRNIVCAASSENDYLSKRSSAKMARQLAYDVGVLVDIFKVVTERPEVYLKKCAEGIRVMDLGVRKVIRPKVSLKGEQQQVVQILQDLSETQEQEDAYEECRKIAEATLKNNLQVETLSPREGLEMLVVPGLLDPAIT